MELNPDGSDDAWAGRDIYVYRKANGNHPGQPVLLTHRKSKVLLHECQG